MALGVSSFAAALLAALALTNAVFATGGAAAGVPDQYRVNLRVFFRAFCPACQWFVGDPLLELIRDEQLRNIVNLRLIPAAGMRDKDGDIECESGVIECTGHRWQACVIDTYHDDVVKYLGTIACIEGDESGRVGDWNTKIQNCLTDEERVVIKECYNTKSKNLLLEMIRKDHAGQVGWMPYVITEDKVLGTASEGVGYNTLLGNVCIAYKGPRESYPDACKQLVGPQKQFPAEEPIAAQQLAPADPMGEKLDPQVNAGEQNNAAPVADEELELDIKDDEPEAPEQVPEAAAADTGKVRMELYWRAFCPGCMSFITKPLLKLMRDQQFQAIVDFVPVPAAGTTFDSEGNFACNKGLVECMGHRWLSCVVEEAPDLGAKIEALACMESGDNKGLTWSAIVGKCFSGGALTKMKTCYDTKSEDLLRKHVATRQKLKIPWVPYVILNGQPIGDASHGITLKYLTESVCSAFTGSQELLPNACQPKRLRQGEQEKEAEEDKVIKPCPPKKEGKDKAVVYEDAPGIGKRVIGDGNTVMELDAKVQGGNIQRHSSFSGQTMILSGLCFVLIAVLVLRFSGDHKKDA